CSPSIVRIGRGWQATRHGGVTCRWIPRRAELVRTAGGDLTGAPDGDRARPRTPGHRRRQRFHHGSHIVRDLLARHRSRVTWPGTESPD
ncbi:MAG: hypothetical protein AVDCRST_MAG57-2622, partial [uncultured Blastococcus sp.]